MPTGPSYGTHGTVPTPEDSPELRELLRSREAVGLRVPLLARLAVLTIGLLNTGMTVVFSDAPEVSPTLVRSVFATLLVGFAINAVLFLRLRRGFDVETIGLVGALFDGLFVVALSGLALRAGADEGLPAGYVFKTAVPVAVVTFVAINGLALRPRYPMIVGAGAVIAMLVPTAMVLADPLTHYEVDRRQVYAGTALDPTELMMTWVMVLGTILAVVFSARAARQTVRRGIARELDHARAQQEQLRLVTREKVRTLTKLVAGVSHEINSPVGALRSGVDTQTRVFEKLHALLEGQGDGDPRTSKMLRAGQQSLDVMRTAADRISTLEASLRALCHLDEADLRKVDLHHELDTVLAAVRRELDLPTAIALELEPVPALYLSASEFNQALLTLVTNAFEAAGPKGTVTVRTVARADSVHIDIADNGPGIAPERISELFDVSFGDRDRRVRAGLGLATAQSVVQRHGGELRVRSRLGQGTTMTIELPVGSASASSVG